MSDTNGRPSKRVRTDEGNANPESSLDDLTQDEEFWLEDGNIVLVTKKRTFKICRGLLAIQSPIFADMFATANPNAGQLYDGCPAIRLSDSPEDLRHLLRALIPKEGTSLGAALAGGEPRCTFNQLSSLTRLGHKYQIGFIEREAIKRLKLYFTDDLEKFPTENLPFDVGDGQEIEAVRLARLSDNLDMLPVVLYVCSILGGAAVHGWTREDGTVETLDAHDLELCVNGYGLLREETPDVLSRIFSPIFQPGCASGPSCRASISFFHQSARRDTQRHSHLDTWHTIYEGWREDTGEDLPLCTHCFEILKKRENDKRLAIWRRLPTIYGLPTLDGWGT
ncbi:hypothetical protein V8D89_010198 [Ganoderma adspersum]